MHWTRFDSASPEGAIPSAFFTDADYAPILLLILLLKVIALGGLFVFFASRLLGRDARQTPNPTLSAASTYFQYAPPTIWLAIRGAEPERALAALGARIDRSADSWDQSFQREQENALYVSPRIDGWILVFGPPLLKLVHDPDIAHHQLRQLSREVGMAQFFYRSPIDGAHGWGILDRGDVLRAYLWEQKTLWNQGVITDGERRLDMRIIDYGSPGEAKSNLDRVFALAERWSLNPLAAPSDAWGDNSWAVGRIVR